MQKKNNNDIELSIITVGWFRFEKRNLATLTSNQRKEIEANCQENPYFFKICPSIHPGDSEYKRLFELVFRLAAEMTSDELIINDHLLTIIPPEIVEICCPNLSTLNLADCMLESVEILQRFQFTEKIQNIWLDANRITNIDSLRKLNAKSLKLISIAANGINQCEKLTELCVPQFERLLLETMENIFVESQSLQDTFKFQAICDIGTDIFYYERLHQLVSDQTVCKDIIDEGEILAIYNRR